ncbi:MAG: LysM peptidoglycan-binding domain-containing protein [Burkholderiaceae bacterium]
MKKFITQAALAVAGLTVSLGLQAQNIGLAKNAPETYTVVKGDTLWDISGRFLQEPWRWPEIWDMNRDSINDPHWIYPGDTIYMDMSGARPRLRLGKPIGGSMAGANGRAGGGTGADNGPGRLSPRVRTQSLSESAIQTFNTAAIDAFLNRPLIVEEEGLKTNPRIVATQEGRVYLSRGDLAYVRGITDETVSEWHVYRPAKPLVDPDTRKPIAYEALYVGTAQLEKLGDPSTLRVSTLRKRSVSVTA